MLLKNDVGDRPQYYSSTPCLNLHISSNMKSVVFAKNCSRKKALWHSYLLTQHYSRITTHANEVILILLYVQCNFPLEEKT